ncbi:secreted phosphoprotein 24 [Molossus nigricans]
MKMTLPSKEMMLKILVMFVVGTSRWPCAGFPVYDYDLSSLRAALGASVAEVNSRAPGPYLFRAIRSAVRRVHVLEESGVSMDLEFSIRETTCRRGSGEDPTTCDFQRGYYVPTASCRSTVRMSAQQVQDVWVRCRWSSSSESDSSEEMIFGGILGSSTWRNNYLLGLGPEKPRSQPFYERSLEIMRRALPPGHRRYPNQRHRAGLNAGYE